MADAAGDATFEIVQVHHEALLTLLPERSPLRDKLQTEMASARLVRRYLAQQPPEKVKTDWAKLVTLLAPLLTLLFVIVASLLGIDWRGVVP